MPKQNAALLKQFCDIHEENEKKLPKEEK
jgi:hypothetical protein